MEGEGRYWISTNQHSYSGDRLPRPLWMDSWRQWCWWEMRVFFKCSKHGHRHVYNRPKGNPIPLSLLTTNIPIHSEIKRIGGSKILTLEKPQFQSRRHWIFDPSLSKKKPNAYDTWQFLIFWNSEVWSSETVPGLHKFEMCLLKLWAEVNLGTGEIHSGWPNTSKICILLPLWPVGMRETVGSRCSWGTTTVLGCWSLRKTRALFFNLFQFCWHCSIKMVKQSLQISFPSPFSFLTR